MRQQIDITYATIYRIGKYINLWSLFASIFMQFALAGVLAEPLCCLQINEVNATGKFKYYLEFMT